MSQKKSPDFIGVGGEKTASTWIYKCLLEHPQICGPKEKELSYFDTVKLIGRPEQSQSRYDAEGIEPYLKYFEECNPEKVMGEFTVTYLHEKKVAPLLAQLFPHVKIIISLRNPIDRSFSQYQGIREVDRNVYGSFEKALTMEPEFTRRSMYAEYIETYLANFPKEQIYIVLQDDVVHDPVGTMQALYRFLGVSDTFVPESAHTKERSAEQKKLQTLRDRIYKNSLTRSIARCAKQLGLTPRIKKFIQSSIKKDAMKSETRKQLQTVFAEDIKKTATLIGRNLSHWN